jgi:hypothetical protein
MEREEFIAEVRHIGWIAYQIAVGQEYNEKINEDQMVSLLDGIEYLDANPDITPEENHNNWMKMKVSQGWVYGEVKDFEKKMHPDLVPFDDLPIVEQRKDINDAVIHKLAVELWDQFEGD